MNANEVTLVIKSPHHEDAPLRFNISLEGTVRDIKERLSQHHPEHPHPKDQRLIFAGKLLTDSSRTVDVLKQVRERATCCHRLLRSRALLKSKGLKAQAPASSCACA